MICILLRLFLLLIQLGAAVCQQIKVPITATEGDPMTITIFNDLGLKEYVLFLVQDRSNDISSVFTTLTGQNSVEAQAIVFPAPSPGDFRIVINPANSTVESGITSDLGSSEEFKVVSNEASPLPTMPPVTDTANTEIPSSTTSFMAFPTVMSVKTPPTVSSTAKSGETTDSISVPALAGGLVGGFMILVLVVAFSWAYLRRRRHHHNQKSSQNIPDIQPYDLNREQSSQNQSAFRVIYNQRTKSSPLISNHSTTGNRTTSLHMQDFQNHSPRSPRRMMIHTDSGWRERDEAPFTEELPPSYTSS
ncbi:hypothetical protein VKT23_000021 [Stygiomarasmius scandens]|uniref:Mid2 domain-containing protein n=1 Tax=Marasmiellus scandens TaxID=2682957 RepID=A0ABR1K5M7_9AGAR